jgi:hypothetical protein
MFRISVCLYAFLLLAPCVLPAAAQQSPSSNTAVPSIVNFSGVLTDLSRAPLTGAVGVTFSLYKESQGESPLWMETQNVQADKAGHYTVALGSTQSQGLPPDIFASGEARWLGVQAQGQAEQPRVLLMSVPYALKALDAETIGGKPVSAFMLAPSSNSANSGSPNPLDNITGSGTAGFVPVFTGTATIGNSQLFQTVANKVGIGTTTPAAKLDVKGTSDVRDTLTLFPKATHPTLSIHGTAFSIDQTGAVTFVAGQTFPGEGTVTSVGSGAGLTGGPITGSGTLSIANGGITNTMLQNPSLTVTANGPLNGGGNVALGSSVSLGLAGCASNQILKWNGSAWACSADSNSGGTVTSVGSGGGLTGGPITTTGALSIANGGVTNTMLQNSALTVTANSPLTGGGAVSLGGSTSLGLEACGANQILKWNGSAWACSVDNNSGGTVTSVGSGLGLTGGPITGSGSLSINTSVVPQLGAFNTFTNTNTVVVNSGADLILSNTSGGDGIDISMANNGYGVYTTGGFEGVQAVGGTFPLVGFGGSLEGVYGRSDTDSDFSPGLVGIEGGGTTKTIGVMGLTSSATGGGVYGQRTSTQSTTGATITFGGSGVWGDAGSSGLGVGVYATADNNSAAIVANGSSCCYTLFAINESASGYPFSAVNATGNGCYIDPSGSINCTGSKNAVVRIDGGQRKVALSAIESPKNWFEDFGSEQLSNGTAVIRLEPEFAQTVNTQLEYHIFLTPKGDCKGLYVAHETSNSFEVHELGGGTSGVRFDYRIVALRKNFENIRMADHTNDPDPMQMIKPGPPIHFDATKLIPPARTAQMMRPITQTTVRKRGK